MHCEKCGMDVGEDNSKFCFSCGAPLKAPTQNEVPVTHPTPPDIKPPSAEKPPSIQQQHDKPLRGRVLVYDQATGKGVISSDGQRFEFNIESWASDNPPNVGMTVEISKNASTTTFSPLDDSVIAKEKLNELGSKVSQHGAEIATEWAQQIGKPILIGYGVFIVGMFFLPFTNLMFAKPSLYEIFKLADYATLAWIAVASIALPQLWKDHRSYYAYAAPGAVLGLALIKAISTAHDAASATSQFGSFFGGKPVNETSLIFETLKNVHFEIGFWVVIFSATWLAYKGFTKVKNPA